MRKKILPVFLAIIIFFTSFLGQVNKAQAFALPLAVPAGGGAVALGAIAVGSVAAGLGIEYGDEITEWGNNVWDKTAQTTKEAWDKVISWVPTGTADPPALKVDVGNLPIELKNSALNQVRSGAGQMTVRDSAKTYESVNSGQYEMIPYQSTTPVTLPTAYPQFEFDLSSVYYDATLTFRFTDTWDRTNANSLVFAVVTPSDMYFMRTLQIDEYNGSRIVSGGFGKSINRGIGIESKIEIRDDALGDLPSTNWESFVPTKADMGKYPTAELALNQLNHQIRSFGSTATIAITTVGTMDQIFQNDINRRSEEAWENMVDAGLVISGPSILEANPGITWDADVGFVDTATGNPADPASLNLPRAKAYEKGIGFPITGGYADVHTGNPVKTGEGTGGEAGTGTGDTGGILTGLWDWLKGILNAILNAIKALAGLLGILALLDAIKTLLTTISDKIGVSDWLDTIKQKFDELNSWRDRPDKKVDWTKLKMAAGTLTTVFPFSIPWDVYRTFTIFDVAPTTPVFNIDTHKTVTIFNTNIPIDFEWKVDFKVFDPIAAVGRWGLVLIFDISIIMALRRLTPD
jgi:hypothetical protein